MKEIVIKIDECILEHLKDGSFGVRPYDRNDLIDAVMNGTPLPKGHGRVADMDAAIKCIEEVKGEDAVWAISLIEWACGKRTLIEADKESEEANERLLDKYVGTIPNS